MGVAAILVIWPEPFRSRVLRSLHMKFEFIWPSGFRGDVWKCWRTDGRRTDGRTDDWVTGILLAYPWAFGSGELTKQQLILYLQIELFIPEGVERALDDTGDFRLWGIIYIHNTVRIHASCNKIRQAGQKSAWERSCSVAECLNRDQRAAGSSLTGVTALWSLSKTHLS